LNFLIFQRIETKKTRFVNEKKCPFLFLEKRRRKEEEEEEEEEEMVT